MGNEDYTKGNTPELAAEWEFKFTLVRIGSEDPITRSELDTFHYKFVEIIEEGDNLQTGGGGGSYDDPTFCFVVSKVDSNEKVSEEDVHTIWDRMSEEAEKMGMLVPGGCKPFLDKDYEEMEKEDHA